MFHKTLKTFHFPLLQNPKPSNTKMGSLSSFSSARRHLLRHCRYYCSLPVSSISAAKSNLSTSEVSDKAQGIFTSVRGRISSPPSSRYALHVAVTRLAKSHRFDDIETLIESQKASPKITTEAFICSLIIAYGRGRMLEHAIRTFDQMDDLGAPRSNISFNSVLLAANHSENYDQVPKLFSELSKKYQITPDKFSYGILIKSLCESNSPESALLILDEMKGKSVEITKVTYTTLLDAFYKKRKVEEAEKLWDEMGKSGCSPDVAAYNVRIMHAAEGKPEDVLKLIEEMEPLGLKPDTISYNYLLTCYCKNNQLDEAKKVYRDLRQNGCVPNAATFRTILFYLCKSGDLNMAVNVFMRSVKKNKIPNFGTTKHLVEGLVKESKLKEAKELIELLKKRFPENFLNAWKKVEVKLGVTEDKGSAPVSAL